MSIRSSWPWITSMKNEKTTQKSLFKRDSRGAFTIIEILIVMVIVAVLVGLLLPTIEAIRAGAKFTQCIGSQRQVVLSCHAYALDSRGGLPATRVSNIYWFSLIGDYLSLAPNIPMSKTFIGGCPEFTYDPSSAPAYSFGINAFLAYGNGGGSNLLHNRIGGSMGSENFVEFKLSKVSKPNTRGYLADSSEFWTGVNPPIGDLEVRHRSRMSVTFVGGNNGRITLDEAKSSIMSPQ